jgi:hypothetical protein
MGAKLNYTLYIIRGKFDIAEILEIRKKGG